MRRPTDEKQHSRVVRVRHDVFAVGGAELEGVAVVLLAVRLAEHLAQNVLVTLGLEVPMVRGDAPRRQKLNDTCARTKALQLA